MDISQNQRQRSLQSFLLVFVTDCRPSKANRRKSAQRVGKFTSAICFSVINADDFLVHHISWGAVRQFRR